jgi:hypothetical protein
MLTATAKLSTRYSFTVQFLHGGAIFTRRAHEIETGVDASISDELQSEHVAHVVGAVTQAAAALEAEISEVLIHGPRGANDLDATARDFLATEQVDRKPTLCKYDLVLRLLRKPAFDRGARLYQNADLLIDLRNELVHYKSKWGEQMDDENVFSRLEQLGFDKPPFMSPHTNFFPHRCLSASLASWSVVTGVEFINAFCHNMTIASPLLAHAPSLTVPLPIRVKQRVAR